jgi:hypothetical protein
VSFVSFPSPLRCWKETNLNIRAFIFSWRGHEARACALEDRIGRLVETRVINSEEGLERRRPHWVHLGEDAYFSAQWNRAVELFDGDLLFHLQADASHDDFAPIIARAAGLFARRRLGIYEPDVDYTDLRYDRAKLTEIEPGLAQVPMTDCTCWFVAGDLLRDLPAVETSRNRYGWGICAAVAALASLRNRPCVRDYSFTVRHPRRRGYPSAPALAQRSAYLRTLPEAVGQRAMHLYRMAAASCDRPRAIPRRGDAG